MLEILFDVNNSREKMNEENKNNVGDFLVKKMKTCENNKIFYFHKATLTLRSHTTRKLHGSHTGSIRPSQFQKTIVRKLSVLCG